MQYDGYPGNQRGGGGDTTYYDPYPPRYSDDYRHHGYYTPEPQMVSVFFLQRFLILFSLVVGIKGDKQRKTPPLHTTTAGKTQGSKHLRDRETGCTALCRTRLHSAP